MKLYQMKNGKRFLVLNLEKSALRRRTSLLYHPSLPIRRCSALPQPPNYSSIKLSQSNAETNIVIESNRTFGIWSTQTQCAPQKLIHIHETRSENLNGEGNDTIIIAGKRTNRVSRFTECYRRSLGGDWAYQTAELVKKIRPFRFLFFVLGFKRN